MAHKKPGESRRKLLKSIAAGSGAIVAGKSLPDSWSRPVVDSVLLPAHAQTSTTSGGMNQQLLTASIKTEDTLLADVADALVSPAQAASNPGNPFSSVTGGSVPAADGGADAILRWTVCVKPASAGAYIVDFMFLAETTDGLYRETLSDVESTNLQVGQTTLYPPGSLVGSCGARVGGISVTLDSYSGGSGYVMFAFGPTQTGVRFDPNGCMLDSPDCIGGRGGGET